MLQLAELISAIFGAFVTAAMTMRALRFASEAKRAFLIEKGIAIVIAFI